MREGEPHELVLDTSVAVKFYLPEESRDEALGLLASVGAGETRLLAPATVQPELLNALWQRHRRGEVSREEVEEYWSDFSFTSMDLYAPEDLMPRAAEIMLETGIVVYDTLFLTLAEAMDTTVVTADDKLLRVVRDTKYSRLAEPLSAWTPDRHRHNPPRHGARRRRVLAAGSVKPLRSRLRRPRPHEPTDFGIRIYSAARGEAPLATRTRSPARLRHL